jgi:hypothetical protein
MIDVEDVKTSAEKICRARAGDALHASALQSPTQRRAPHSSDNQLILLGYVERGGKERQSRGSVAQAVKATLR